MAQSTPAARASKAGF